MGIFSTRNSDGASGRAEPNSTVSATEMARIREQAVKHNPAKAAVFTDEGDRYRRAHDSTKAGTN